MRQEEEHVQHSAPGCLNLCGPQVRQRRQMHGWSQEQFRKQLRQCGLDLDHIDIDLLERGQRVVSDRELACLSRLFAVPPDQLVWDGARPDTPHLREKVREIRLREAGQ